MSSLALDASPGFLPPWLSMIKVRAKIRRARESQEMQFP